MAVLAAAPVAAQDLALIPPLDCDLGATCFIQQYMDRDPGPGAQDFACGRLSYDGHTGTDFALPDLAMMDVGVNVVAAAPGRVKATRDGVADIAASDPGAPDITGRECGNGVAIDHQDGWETQYCHLKQGSITVTNGQNLAAGTILGQVGLSGQTQFPHVHLTVRRNGIDIDPFDPAATATCASPAPASLWRIPPPYRPGGLIRTGFATRIPEYDAIKSGLAPPGTLPPDSPALVLWAYAFGGRAGDTVSLSITGPGGVIAAQDPVLDKDQAQFFRAAGKRRPPFDWPAGRYQGTATLLRQGTIIDHRTISLTIP